MYIPDRDGAGRSVVRTAATKKGWHYQALFFEYQTSTGLLYCKDSLGVDLSDNFNVTRYDSLGNITTNSLNTVKNVITWKPNMDYEIISGSIKQTSLSSSDLRVWVTGGMFNEAANYEPLSTKEFVTGGMNLALMSCVETDGRASKFMVHTTEGAPFPTNRFQYIFEHAAGFEKSVLICVELFKE